MADSTNHSRPKFVTALEWRSTDDGRPARREPLPSAAVTDANVDHREPWDEEFDGDCPEPLDDRWLPEEDEE